ncbi:TRAP transporter small permease [Billgrantia endophytica]|uniref:TRAP transporter small permease protein n=1 Tax=Billgrantia endophytica TaxID=2033802 RepID=A0A2N7TWQ9_9GAMM|nr:TRAP transporter small permease [Halomonas endophytica]PMR72620.1 TRAP transporter small permease [Halomonas endophytica]
MSRKPDKLDAAVDPMADFEAAFDSEAFCFGDYAVEDYAVLVVFWALILVVSLQFFTRYVLGDSTTWTEEVARYLLIVIGFVGSAMAVRKGTHIVVEFFYRYMPDWLARLFAGLADLVSVGFYLAMAWVTYKLAGRTASMMVSVDLPKSLVYYIVCAAFVMMALRGIQRIVIRARLARQES